ncbi:MAG: hypothetical protein WEB58_16510 [Planctomycetaceae bacterium]
MITRVTWGFLLLVVLVLWSVLDVRHRVIDQFHRAGSTATLPSSGSAVPAVDTHEISDEPETFAEHDAVEAKRPIDRELSATSWRNPFELKWWRAPGWIAVTEGMQGSGTARFRKAFVRVSLSLVVEAVDETIVPQPSIRLENADDGDLAVVVHWDQDLVTVWRERKGHAPRKIRETPLPETVSRRGDQHRRQLQLIATGNRLIVAESGRRLVFCDQPSEISGRPFRFTLNTVDQEVRLRDLRLDGE